MPPEHCSASIGLSVYVRIAEYPAKKSPKCFCAPGFLLANQKSLEEGDGVWGREAFLQKSFTPFPANNTY